MKYLSLYRHAHSQPAIDDQLDHERPLSPRGEQECAGIGKEMKKRGWKPDLVLCSTSARTKSTLGLTSLALGQELVVTFTNKLYLATPGDIFKLISEVAPSVESLMVIGHNPGLHQCCMLLAQQGNREALATLGQGFAPASMAVFRLDIEMWNELSPASETFLMDVLVP